MERTNLILVIYLAFKQPYTTNLYHNQQGQLLKHKNIATGYEEYKTQDVKFMGLFLGLEKLELTITLSPPEY